MIAEARIRNAVPLDVNSLMKQAENQHAVDVGASHAMKEAEGISEIRHIMKQVAAGTFHEESDGATSEKDGLSPADFWPPPVVATTSK